MLYVLFALSLGVLALVAFILFGGPRLPRDTDEIIEQVSQRDL